MKFLLRCKPTTKNRQQEKKVAIIGAGPAGLGAAGVLLCNGHEVHIYDALPEPGGLLIFGIPPFRIPRENVREGVKGVGRGWGRSSSPLPLSTAARSLMNTRRFCWRRTSSTWKNLSTDTTPL
jgi:hypothetical protein